jgi:hypothetical protein
MQIILLHYRMYLIKKQFKMDTYVSQPGIQTPTNVIKNLDAQPVQSMVIIEEKDFKKFVPSGWKVIVDLPLKRVNNRAIFAIDISGFQPYWNLNDSFYPTALKNLAPVQAFESALDYVHIQHEQVTLPIISMYHSHRAYSGNVKVGLRVQSNTTQSGSFMVTQINTAARNYYRNTEVFKGLRFLNASAEGTDYAMSSFFLGDLSINRNWSITPMSQNILPEIDLAHKLSLLEQYMKVGQLPQDLTTLNPFVTQFTEDWLAFMPLSDLPNNNSNQITFEIFFDYSDIQFYTPMLPFLASTNTDSDKQILNVSATINNRSFTKLTAVWGISGLNQRLEEDNEEETHYDYD